MAIAFVNAANGSWPGDTTTTITTPATSLTAGNLCIFTVRWSGSTAISSVADTAGNTYTLVRYQMGASSSLAMYYVNNCLGHGSNVITVTWGSSVSFRSMCAMQYSGTTDYSLAVTSSGVAGTGGSVTSNMTLTAEDALVVTGLQLDATGTTWTAGSGMTLRGGDAQNVTQMEDAIITSNTTITPAATNSNTGPPLNAVTGVFTSTTIGDPGGGGGGGGSFAFVG